MRRMSAANSSMLGWLSHAASTRTSNQPAKVATTGSGRWSPGHQSLAIQSRTQKSSTVATGRWPIWSGSPPSAAHRPDHLTAIEPGRAGLVRSTTSRSGGTGGVREPETFSPPVFEGCGSSRAYRAGISRSWVASLARQPSHTGGRWGMRPARWQTTQPVGSVGSVWVTITLLGVIGASPLGEVLDGPLDVLGAQRRRDRAQHRVGALVLGGHHVAAFPATPQHGVVVHWVSSSVCRCSAVRSAAFAARYSGVGSDLGGTCRHVTGAPVVRQRCSRTVVSSTRTTEIHDRDRGDQSQDSGDEQDAHTRCVGGSGISITPHRPRRPAGAGGYRPAVRRWRTRRTALVCTRAPRRGRGRRFQARPPTRNTL